MGKHTPGPWIDQHFDGNQQITINATAFRGPNVLALVRPPLTFDAKRETYECTHADVDEAAANARLIASAPDLLENLKLIAALARFIQVLNRVEAVGEILERAEAAIAKAEGK